jgi:hypothetical protein
MEKTAFLPFLPYFITYSRNKITLFSLYNNLKSAVGAVGTVGNWPNSLINKEISTTTTVESFGWAKVGNYIYMKNIS